MLVGARQEVQKGDPCSCSGDPEAAAFRPGFAQAIKMQSSSSLFALQLWPRLHVIWRFNLLCLLRHISDVELRSLMPRACAPHLRRQRVYDDLGCEILGDRKNQGKLIGQIPSSRHTFGLGPCFESGVSQYYGQSKPLSTTQHNRMVARVELPPAFTVASFLIVSRDFVPTSLPG